MRQRRWMEFLKDYMFRLNYHPRKANMVGNALSQKSLHASWIMVKEDELVKSFRDLNLGVVMTLHNLRLNQLRVTGASVELDQIKLPK